MAQRNTPGVSAVLARQEIERSAASTIREAMHLVPGIAVSGDNGIVVRGLKGRWNEIAIDGVPMPDYDPSYAIFSFDLLPISSVESIRLLKSSTPDIETGFGSSMICLLYTSSGVGENTGVLNGQPPSKSQDVPLHPQCRRG